MDKLIAKELVFRFSCKSLDGLVMSISVDEFIRMLPKDDPTFKKLRDQFVIKSKLNTEKMMEDGEDRNDIMSFIYALLNDNALVRLILFSYKKMMFSQ